MAERMDFITGIFVWIILGQVRSEVFDRNICPSLCKCEGHIIRCNRNVLNEAIPDNVSEVYLKTDFDTSFEMKIPSLFSHWSNVIKLDITVTGNLFYLHFEEHFFRPLKQLQYLGIHGIVPASYVVQDYVLHTGCFSGLDNVKTLNLSGNSQLNVSEVIKALKEVNTLPKLETIDLSELQLLTNKPIYKKEFVALVSVLRIRPVKTIIMDYTDIELPVVELAKLCQTIENFSLKKATIIAVYGFQHTPCESLKVLDMSEAVIVPLNAFIRSRILTSNRWFVGTFNKYLSLLCKVETVYYNGILPSKPHTLSFDIGTVYNATGIIWGVKYLYFRRNFMENFNVSFKIMPLLPGTEFDVSYNNIHYIHPKSLDPGHNIRKINLAHNQLHEMERNYPLDFSIFLHTFADLEDINLAYNKITTFPSDMLSKNPKLKTIDFAGNHLKTLSIKISSVPNLQYLDVVNNHIETFVLGDISKINPTPFGEENITFVTDFIINITGNELNCKCDDISFVKSIRDSPFVRGGKCAFEDEKLHINHNAVEIITARCHEKKFKQKLVISVCISIALFYLAAICIALAVRYKKKQNKIKELLRQLRTDGDQFLVFISYCSEDTDFVMTQLVNHLNEEICINTKVNGDHICTGDRFFRPGFPVITEIMAKMENSAVIIFVISLAFCNKLWCHIEVKEAYELQKPIILMFKEEVNLQEMPKLVEKLFHQNTRCKFERDADGAWEMQPSFHVLASSIIELAAISNTIGTPKNVE